MTTKFTPRSGCFSERKSIGNLLIPDTQIINGPYLTFNGIQPVNDYFKSDLIYDSPGKDLIPSEQNGGDDDKALESSVTVENRMFVQVKKKNSLSSSLFEYVIICELGHQTEFPATFTRSHSSAVRMNFLLARVACA